MLAAAEIIEQARECHPSFTPQFSPESVCYRFLNRYQRDLATKLLRADPEALVVTEVITLPLADFAAGFTLSPHIDVRPVAFLIDSNDESCEIQRTNASRRLRPDWRPAFYVEAGVFYLTMTETYWTAFTEVHVRLVPAFDALDAATSAFGLPDTAESALVAALAAFLGGRATNHLAVTPVDRQELRAEANTAEAEFLRQAQRATVTDVRETW